MAQLSGGESEGSCRSKQQRNEEDDEEGTNLMNDFPLLVLLPLPQDKLEMIETGDLHELSEKR